MIGPLESWQGPGAVSEHSGSVKRPSPTARSAIGLSAGDLRLNCRLVGQAALRWYDFNNPPSRACGTRPRRAWGSPRSVQRASGESGVGFRGLGAAFGALHLLTRARDSSQTVKSKATETVSNSASVSRIRTYSFWQTENCHEQGCARGGELAIPWRRSNISCCFG